MSNRIISIVLITAMLLWIGCTDTKQFTRQEFVANGESGEIIVLTKDNQLYRFTRQSYQIKGDSLVGRGGLRRGEQWFTFAGAIALTDVEFVQADRPNGVKTALLVGGIAAGVALMALAAAASSMKGWGGGSGGGSGGGLGGGGKFSCPFVYTHDGTNYHIESETFAGAVFKGLERPTFDNLYHLKPVAGEYKLQLRNAGEETEYVNELKLITVDHPIGTRIVPDMRGVIHTIEHPELPMMCNEFNGKDALKYVIDDDSLYWESDLSNKDVTRESDLRDGLILEFNKPANAKSAKIVVNGINSHLGFFALEHLFKLKGENKLQWFQELEHNPVEKGKFINWLKREGMLHIKLWQDGQWVEQALMYDVGPLIAKDQIAVLDISTIRDTRLRVKLESATDLWRIDHVYVDYSADRTVNARELAPFAAIDESGKDVAPLLISSDTIYYTTFPGQYATLRFKEVAGTPESKRSFVLKTKGYYHQWIDAAGPDNKEMVERILTEPLYGSKVLMPKWKESKRLYGENSRN